MTGHGIILPERTDDASAIPGLSDIANSNTMADTGSLVTPIAYYPLQPSGRQKSSESISILSRIKRLNRTGSPEHCEDSFVSQKVNSAKRTQEDTLHSSGSPLQKRDANPDVLFVKSPQNSAVTMQHQERQKRMQQQQRRHQDSLLQPQQQHQEDTVVQHSNLPPNINKMIIQQDQSLCQAQLQQDQQQLQRHQEPMSAPAKHHTHRQQPDSARRATHLPSVKLSPRLQTHSTQPSSRLARMSSVRDPADQNTFPSLLKVHLHLHALTLVD